MIEIFGENGHLCDIIRGYEFRKEQLDMADFALERFLEKEHAAIEAGTGTGKTLAYLIPALIYAKKNGLKAAVTTETKALQKQLLDKDLPIVKRLFAEKLEIDFTYALCMGSSNYPCRQRYEATVKKGLFDAARLSSLHELMFSGKIFSRFDISLPVEIWQNVCREPDACRSFHCPYANKCSFMRARKEWVTADLLVMNHYIFFTNIASGQTYLPHSDIIIFDEAHSLEDVGCGQLGFDCTFSALTDIIDRLHVRRRKGTLLNGITDDTLREKAILLWGDIHREGQRFFENMRSIVSKRNQWQRVREPLNEGHAFIAVMKSMVELILKAREFFDDEYQQMELDILQGKLYVFSENLEKFLKLEQNDYVYWLESDGNSLLPEIHCKGQPIRIGEIIQKEVLRKCASALFVSATLSVNGDFSYIASRLGLERFKTSSLPSSFDYKKQAIFYVDKKMPKPVHPDYIRYAAFAAAEIIKIVNGNCLILFTSYKMLEEVRSLLAGMIPHRIYSQGDMPSQEAVAMYMDDDNSVLMGTHSFWQGIDLPGDMLRCVIMARLPFSAPSPLVQARIDELTEQGRNAFTMYQVPEAVIKFRQGFGRLIRGKKDYGIIAVLDNRIVSESYGQKFLRSVPDCRQVSQLRGLADDYNLIADEIET
ncbi:MAG: ATP-dependent DNA helicase [Leptospirales bacterium]|nr:ATP-dependent DNA helicase [Leptospirales bacterium]